MSIEKVPEKWKVLADRFLRLWVRAKLRPISLPVADKQSSRGISVLTPVWGTSMAEGRTPDTASLTSEHQDLQPKEVGSIEKPMTVLEQTEPFGVIH